jgi:hypothetical protein
MMSEGKPKKDGPLQTAIKAYKDKYPVKGKGMKMEDIIAKYGYKDETEAVTAMIVAAQWMDAYEKKQK